MIMLMIMLMILRMIKFAVMVVDVYAKKTNSKPVVGICGSNIYVGQC